MLYHHLQKDNFGIGSKEIENIKKEFETEVYKIIKENTNLKEWSGKDETCNIICLYPEIIAQVFNEIQNNVNRRKLSFSMTGNNPIILFNIFFDNSDTKTLFSIIKCLQEFDKMLNKIKGIIDKLVDDDSLKMKVEKYKKECNLFYNNADRKTFFTSIDNLYKDILYQNKLMNKKGICNNKKCVITIVTFYYLTICIEYTFEAPGVEFELRDNA